MIWLRNRRHQNAGAILHLVMAGDLAKAGVCPIEHHSLNLIKRSSESSCQLGINTILSLGIIPDNRWSKRSQWSLYGAIEPSLKTKQGRRLLRASLLQPLISVSTILERQNAIAELAGARVVQDAVQEFLATAPRDVHKCIPASPLAVQGDTLAKASLTTSSAFIQSVLRLRTLLSAIEVRHVSSRFAVCWQALGAWLPRGLCCCPSLAIASIQAVQTPWPVRMQSLGESLAETTTPLLKGIMSTILRPELGEMRKAIAAVIDEAADCSNTRALTTMQMCYTVKPFVNKFLDSARASFNSLTEELQQKVRPPLPL